MKPLFNGIAALACMATSASAQEIELPNLSNDPVLMEMVADMAVPLRYITVVPDFVVSLNVKTPQNGVQTLEMPPTKNPLQLKSVHLSAVFMDRQSGQYMSTDCNGIDKISQTILIESLKEKSEMGKMIMRAQLKQFQKAGEELKCPSRPLV